MIFFACMLSVLPWTLPRINFPQMAAWITETQKKIKHRLVGEMKADTAQIMQQIIVRLEAGIPLEQACRQVEDKIIGKGKGSLAVLVPELGKIITYAQILGAPLVQVLNAGAKALIEAEKTAFTCKEALAGPRTSAKILAILPLFALLLGGGLGADPVAVFSDLKYGTLAFLLGIIALCAGWFWNGKILAKAEKENQNPYPEALDPAVAVDLANAGLQVGIGIASVILALGEAANDAPLKLVGESLKYGVDWEEAWEYQHSPLSKDLRQALTPAWIEGVNPEILLQQQGEKIRYARESKAREAAQKLGVKLVLPLGICMLPAFICLGVVPLIISGIAF